MRYLRTALSAAALALALVLGGCGGGEEPSQLSDEVRAVEDAVESGDRGAALHALEVLRIEITAAQQSGEFDDERFAALQALLYESRVLVDAVLPPPPATAPPVTEPDPTTTTRPSPPPPDEDDDEDEDEDDRDEEVNRDSDDDGPGNGRGRARGHGRDAD